MKGLFPLRYLGWLFTGMLLWSSLSFGDRVQYLVLPHSKYLIDNGWDGSGCDEDVYFECWLTNPSGIAQTVSLEAVLADNADIGVNPNGGTSMLLNSSFDPGSSYHWVQRYTGPAGPGKRLPKLFIARVRGDSGFMLGGCSHRSGTEGHMGTNNAETKRFETEYLFNGGKPF